MALKFNGLIMSFIMIYYSSPVIVALLTTDKKLIYPQWIQLVQDPAYYMKGSPLTLKTNLNPIDAAHIDFGVFGDTEEKPEIIIPMEGKSGPQELNIYLTKQNLVTGVSESNKFSTDFRRLKKYFSSKQRKTLKRGLVSEPNGRKYPILLNTIADGKMEAIFKYDRELYKIEPFKSQIAKTSPEDQDIMSQNAHIIYRI